MTMKKMPVCCQLLFLLKSHYLKLILFQFTGKYAEGDGYEHKDDETLKQKLIGFVC